MVNELITTLSPPGKREQQWLAVFLISIIILFVLLERSMGLQTAQAMVGIFIGIATVLFGMRSRIEIERTIFVAIFLFILMGVLSVSSSTVMEESIFSLIHYIGIFLVFVLAFSISMKEELFLEWLTNILLLFGTGYVGYYLIDGFSSGSFLSGQKLIGTFTWHNQMAAFILYLIPIAVVFAWKYRVDRRAWFFSAIVLLHAIALALTYSRGAWLSAVATGVIAIILGVRVSSFSRRAIVIAVGGCILSALVLFRIPALNERAGLILVEFFSSTRSISGELRLTSIQSAWEMVNDYPVTGVGIGAYGAANYMYQSRPWLYARDTHNHYMQILAEMGWPGLVSFGILFAILGYYIVRFIRTSISFDNHTHHVWFSLVLGLVASMLHNLVDFDWNWVNLSVLFWIVAGTVTGYAVRHLARREKLTILSIRKPIMLFGLFVILVSGWLFWYTREIKVSRQLLIEANYEVAVEYLDSATDILPISYKSQLDLGFSYRRLKQYELAKLHYQKAIALNPYVAESWFGLGVVAEETEDIEAAIPYYQKAVTINPYSHPRSHAALARMYHQQYDYETAASILQKAVTDYYPINGNYRQMETVFKSTSFNTEVVNLYAYYAEVLMLLGQKEDAQHFLAIAQDLDPNNLRVKLVESLISL